MIDSSMEWYWILLIVYFTLWIPPLFIAIPAMIEIWLEEQEAKRKGETPRIRKGKR